MTIYRIDEKKAKWCPIPVSELDAMLSKLIQEGYGAIPVSALKKNIAYSLQYLEYLDKCLSELSITSAIETQIYKNFICVGCGIIEAVLEFLLIKSGHHAVVESKEFFRSETNWKKHASRMIKIECVVYEKLNGKKLVEMRFEAMIKRAEDKKLLGPDHGVYAKLKKLRKLRNRIHLQLIDSPTDTDWNAFGRSNLGSMAQVLHAVFTGPLFKPDPKEKGYFDYLTGKKYKPIERAEMAF